MKTLGIIPARYASSRFPGKPLVDLLGKPLVWYVYSRAKQALEHVVVATDDKRIFQTVTDLGGFAIMTSQNHKSGTERCAEAVLNVEKQLGEKFDLVINIQGDEPLIEPPIISTLEKNFTPQDQIATLIKQETDAENLFDPNVVKVLVDKNKNAIYFSRQTIPYLRDIPKKQWLENFTFYSHIGIYAYRKDILLQITKLEPTPLEKAEKLEQLRWIENGYKIKTSIVVYDAIGVDTPADLEKVKQILLSKNKK